MRRWGVVGLAVVLVAVLAVAAGASRLRTGRVVLTAGSPEGTVDTPDGPLTVTAIDPVPTARVTVTALAPPRLDLPPGLRLVGGAVRLDADGARVSQQAVVTFPVGPADADGRGGDPDPVVVWAVPDGPSRTYDTIPVPGGVTVADLPVPGHGYVVGVDEPAVAAAATADLRARLVRRVAVPAPVCAHPVTGGEVTVAAEPPGIPVCFGSAADGWHELAVANPLSTDLTVIAPASWRIDDEQAGVLTFDPAYALGIETTDSSWQRAVHVGSGATVRLRIPPHLGGEAQLAVSEIDLRIAALDSELTTYAELSAVVDPELSAAVRAERARVHAVLETSPSGQLADDVRTCGQVDPAAPDDPPAPVVSSGAVEVARLPEILDQTGSCVPLLVEDAARRGAGDDGVPSLSGLATATRDAYAGWSEAAVQRRTASDLALGPAGRTATIELATTDRGPTLGDPWGPFSDGYGLVRSGVVYNGGDSSGAVGDVRWDSWGGPVAVGHGEGIRGRVVLYAYDLGPCHGHLAYRQLQWDDDGARFDPTQENGICDFS